jgi:hypothetical protein
MILEFSIKFNKTLKLYAIAVPSFTISIIQRVYEVPVCSDIL